MKVDNIKDKDLIKLQEIAIRRRSAFYVPELNSDKKRANHDFKKLAAFLKILGNYGMFINPYNKDIQRAQITDTIMQSFVDAISKYYELVPGAIMLYPNFPKEVEETPELLLFVDAVLYAFSGFSLLPEKNSAYDRVLEEYTSQKSLREIFVVSNDDMINIFWNLLAAKTAPSQNDEEDMLFLLHFYQNDILSNATQTEIPFKETMAKMTIEFRKLGISTEHLLHTPTDLLRVMQYVAEEKTDLMGRFALPKFDGSVQSFVQVGLSKMRFNPEDIWRYREEWKHVFRFVSHNSVIEKYIPYLYRNKKVGSFYQKEDELWRRLEKVKTC